MELEASRKRSATEAVANANGGFKKSRFEMESFSPGIGSKSKPCTKFFSTSGCPFGETCHFLHCVPGGVKVVASMLGLGGVAVPPPPPVRYASPAAFSNGSPVPTVKTRLCNKYSTAEGCKFGERCHFAHGEWELGRSVADAASGRYGVGGPSHHPMDPPVSGLPAGFGASANVKISVDASLVGAVLGRGGSNSKQVCRSTGVKLYIRDHDSDPKLRNIELEGSLDQIKEASAMVGELIMNVRRSGVGAAGAGSGFNATNNFRTKLCDNFASGSCTFGERCHFAHGIDQLRKS